MDVTQEAFIRVHRYLDHFKGSSSFYTWVYRITVNLCIDHLRKQSKASTVDYDDAIGHDQGSESELMPSTLGMHPGRNLDRRELRETILQALETLSPAHRAVILMREVEGLSYKEMALAMEVSTGTIMSRLFHARRRMQAALLAILDRDATGEHEQVEGDVEQA
jgi:RNA polymerase sigma-70 factor (ECF subfamily)